MKDGATMHTGPLGSTIHVLRADAETIAALAAVDWNRHFRRVWLDPVQAMYPCSIGFLHRLGNCRPMSRWCSR